MNTNNISKKHPGYHIKRLCIDTLCLSVGDAANLLGVPRANFSLLINGRMGISADMAVRLEKVFGESAEYWLDLQKKYELSFARKKNFKLKKYHPR